MILKERKVRAPKGPFIFLRGGGGGGGGGAGENGVTNRKTALKYFSNNGICFSILEKDVSTETSKEKSSIH